jgi:preprotein translocase subunit SecE
MATTETPAAPEGGTSAADIAKLVVAAALVIAGVVGYYWLADSALILRVLCVIGGVLAGAAVAWLTTPGRQFTVFATEAIAEVKKVVWPTRKETMQTTAAVFAFVVVMAVFLWVSDKTLEWVLYELILGWKKT